MRGRQILLPKHAGWGPKGNVSMWRLQQWMGNPPNQNPRIVQPNWFGILCRHGKNDGHAEPRVVQPKWFDTSAAMATMMSMQGSRSKRLRIITMHDLQDSGWLLSFRSDMSACCLTSRCYEEKLEDGKEKHKKKGDNQIVVKNLAGLWDVGVHEESTNRLEIVELLKCPEIWSPNLGWKDLIVFPHDRWTRCVCFRRGPWNVCANKGLRCCSWLTPLTNVLYNNRCIWWCEIQACHFWRLSILMMKTRRINLKKFEKWRRSLRIFGDIHETSVVMNIVVINVYGCVSGNVWKWLCACWGWWSKFVCVRRHFLQAFCAMRGARAWASLMMGTRKLEVSLLFGSQLQKTCILLLKLCVGTVGRCCFVPNHLNSFVALNPLVFFLKSCRVRVDWFFLFWFELCLSVLLVGLIENCIWWCSRNVLDLDCVLGGLQIVGGDLKTPPLKKCIFVQIIFQWQRGSLGCQTFHCRGSVSIPNFAFNSSSCAICPSKPRTSNNINLYVRHVFNMGCGELVPEWFNFVKSVVVFAIERFPRNSSSAKQVLRVMEKIVVEKCLQMVAKIAETTGDCKSPMNNSANAWNWVPLEIVELRFGNGCKDCWKEKWLQKFYDQFGKCLEFNVNENSTNRWKLLSCCGVWHPKFGVNWVHQLK